MSEITPKALITDAMVTRFLTWPLPDGVCADLCATRPNTANRTGTNLLSAVEARMMLEHVLVGYGLILDAAEVERRIEAFKEWLRDHCGYNKADCENFDAAFAGTKAFSGIALPVNGDRGDGMRLYYVADFEALKSRADAAEKRVETLAEELAAEKRRMAWTAAAEAKIEELEQSVCHLAHLLSERAST